MHSTLAIAVTASAACAYPDEVASLNDLASLISYASRYPGHVYVPIKGDLFEYHQQQKFTKPHGAVDKCPEKINSGGSGGVNHRSPITRHKHNISYVPVDDNPRLDAHLMQIMHNGLTCVCVLNEWEVAQSSCLQCVRLEADNATLIWSRPAWDISNEVDSSWLSASGGSGSAASATDGAAATGPASGLQLAGAGKKNTTNSTG